MQDVAKSVTEFLTVPPKRIIYICQNITFHIYPFININLIFFLYKTKENVTRITVYSVISCSIPFVFQFYILSTGFMAADTMLSGLQTPPNW